MADGYRSVESTRPAGEVAFSTVSVGLLDPRGQLLHEVPHRSVLTDHAVDLRVGVDDRRVIAAAELLADLGQRRVGQLAREVHRHLARVGDRLGALLAT